MTQGSIDSLFGTTKSRKCFVDWCSIDVGDFDILIPLIAYTIDRSLKETLVYWMEL